jgi:hypothetical protein
LDIEERPNNRIAWFFVDTALYIFEMIEIPAPVIAAAGAVAGVAGSGKGVRIDKLCSLAGDVDRTQVLSVVTKLCDAAESLIQKQAGGIWDFYIANNPAELTAAVRLVKDYISRLEITVSPSLSASPSLSTRGGC